MLTAEERRAIVSPFREAGLSLIVMNIGGFMAVPIVGPMAALVVNMGRFRIDKLLEDSADTLGETELGKLYIKNRKLSKRPGFPMLKEWLSTDRHGKHIGFFVGFVARAAFLTGRAVRNLALEEGFSLLCCVAVTLGARALGKERINIGEDSAMSRVFNGSLIEMHRFSLISSVAWFFVGRINRGGRWFWVLKFLRAAHCASFMPAAEVMAIQRQCTARDCLVLNAITVVPRTLCTCIALVRSKQLEECPTTAISGRVPSFLAKHQTSHWKMIVAQIGLGAWHVGCVYAFSWLGQQHGRDRYLHYLTKLLLTFFNEQRGLPFIYSVFGMSVGTCFSG